MKTHKEEGVSQQIVIVIVMYLLNDEHVAPDRFS
jgi:hypothetical protein